MAPGHHRRYKRRAFKAKAEIRVQDRTFGCGVINLSAGGLKLEIAQTLEADTSVELQLGGGKALAAKVAWSDTSYCGLQFESSAEDVAAAIKAIAED